MRWRDFDGVRQLIKLDFSSICNHTVSDDHLINDNNFRYLDHVNSQAVLKILESLDIHEQKTYLNTAATAVFSIFPTLSTIFFSMSMLSISKFSLI